MLVVMPMRQFLLGWEMDQSKQAIKYTKSPLRMHKSST